MGFGIHFVISPGSCFSTADDNEYINKHYHKTDNDDEKTIPDWFYLPYCDEHEKVIELTNNICSEHLWHRIFVACNPCQNNFRTLSSGDVRCSTCCWSIERKLKAYTVEELKKLAIVIK